MASYPISSDEEEEENEVDDGQNHVGSLDLDNIVDSTKMTSPTLNMELLFDTDQISEYHTTLDEVPLKMMDDKRNNGDYSHNRDADQESHISLEDTRKQDMLIELYDDDKEKHQWQETARWIHYEEDAEGVDLHWGKPHVAFLSFHGLNQIRNCVSRGVLVLDCEARNFKSVCERIAEAMQREYNMDGADTARVIINLNKRTNHISEEKTGVSKLKFQNPFQDPKPGRKKSLLDRIRVIPAQENNPNCDVNKFCEGMDQFSQQELMKIVPKDAESCQVFCGTMKECKRIQFCMVRMRKGTCFPEILAAPIPIRFVVVILGPEMPDMDYHEIGRSLSTLMADPLFRIEAYDACNKMDLVRALDAFLDRSVVIPPCEIESTDLLEVDDIKKALKKRSKIQKDAEDDIKQRMISSKEKKVDPLARTGIPFGGVVQDIKNRLKFYASDFKDALNFQCITAAIFMFFASFAPAITFGGLMGDYTDGYMGPMETLAAQCVGGIIWGFFSVQPLMIMSPTGPVLIFEASMYKFCKALGLDFLVLRVWTGIWVLFLALLVVAFEGVFLVSYVTQFTEDIFSCLISIIFIAECLKFLQKSFAHHPVMHLGYYQMENRDCLDINSHFYLTDSRLIMKSRSDFAGTPTLNMSAPFFQKGLSYSMNPETYANCPSLASVFKEMSSTGLYDDNVIRSQIDYCCSHENQPDTGLLTVIMVFTTFCLAFILKKLKTSQYLGKTLRGILSDFGVLIAIFIVTLLDALVFHEPYLKQLSIPARPMFTNAAKRKYGLLIPFFLPGDKWWGYLFAAVPAFLVFILLFVETEITGLLLNKKEKGLRKGCGFHWDLLLVGVMTFVCSIFGLPWMCAAAVQSLAHASSLSVMKRKAPGQAPTVDYVIEQRITTIVVSIMIGACTFAGGFLKLLPLAVLFGVFLFLGVMNLSGVTMLERIILFFIPKKYYPDAPYCREVSYWRMHLFTFIQVVCLILIYMVKHFKVTSLGFPFVLMLIAGFRVVGLPKIFKPKELHALDGHDEGHED